MTSVPNVRAIDTKEMVDELKRRNVYLDDLTADELRAAAKRNDIRLRVHRDRPSDRTVALLTTGALTALLILAIVVIAIRGNPIPDVLSGLAGTGLGAIAGLLAGPSLAESPQIPSQQE